jgi:hypothetical protein
MAKKNNKRRALKRTTKRPVKKAAKGTPTPSQARALRTRTTSFGVRFTRANSITRAHNSKGEWVDARSPGKLTFLSVRRFCTEKEAQRHGRRFAKKHGHQKFEVVALKKRPNAWVNWKTGKTNPVI